MYAAQSAAEAKASSAIKHAPAPAFTAPLPNEYTAYAALYRAAAPAAIRINVIALSVSAVRVFELNIKYNC